MSQDEYLELSADSRLHYLDVGEGRPVLFLPGWASAADCFRGQLRMLGDAGWRSLALDPRNHGGSSDDTCATSYRAQADDIAALTDALDLRGVVLVGWSFGALACWEYLAAYSFERVAGLVVIDQPAILLSEDASEYRGNSRAGFEAQVEKYLSDEAGFRQFVEEKFLDGIFFDEPPTDPLVRELFVRWSLRVPLDVARALFVDGHMRDEREIACETYKRIPCQFFVANYRREQGIHCLSRDYPRPSVESFGNHMMFWEYPERFFNALTSFLRDNNLE